MATTDEGLYKLVIVGGGPAGIGVFIRATRTGFLPRLLDPARHGTQRDLDLSTRCGRMQKGVAVLHDGDASSFGSGNLGQYLINSNTFAKSLLSSVLDEKPDLDPPESIKHTFLEHAREHPSTQRLEQIGLAPACLVEMGNFLTYVGSRVLAEVAAHSDASACLLHTRATRFDVLENGVIRVEAQNASGESVVLYTEHLALAMGGKQELPTLESPALNAKLFTSETCLREDGFAQLREHLLKAPDRKVCIVGGSHSSFSVAWMLLNRFSTKSASVTSRGSNNVKSKPSSSAQQQLPQSQSQQLDTAPTAVTAEPVPPEDDSSESKATPSTDNSPTKKSALPALKELVITPVSLEPLVAASGAVTPSTATTPLGKCESVRKPSKADPFAVFKPKDITILHRTPIRCYYASKKDAEADGVDSSRVDRTGCVNTFTGLREDSKNLFKDVKAGRETRVRLFHVNQHGSQSLTVKAYESASAIVWCCGYKTRMIPGFDAQGNAIAFYEENGVVKLDLTARLQQQQQAGALGASKDTLTPVANVFGLGLGFSLRSAVDEMGTETRADGVTVYHRRGAALVLAALFGPEVFGSDAKTFEEMVEKVRACGARCVCEAALAVMMNPQHLLWLRVSSERQEEARATDNKERGCSGSSDTWCIVTEQQFAQRQSQTVRLSLKEGMTACSSMDLSHSAGPDCSLSRTHRHSSKPLGAHGAIPSKSSSNAIAGVPSKVTLTLQPVRCRMKSLSLD